MNNDTPREDRTIIVDRYVQAGRQNDGGENSYKGLRIHALPGLHAYVGEQARLHLRAAGRVLDLAAGSGAMSQRLVDLGFEVTATDYVGSAFRLHGSVPFFEADLNRDFADLPGRRFDAIVASEIIEHLENPRHFARQAFRLLEPGGRMILSTPNIDSIASKLTFLTSSKFLWFNEPQYHGDGHITPVSQWQIGKVLQEAGFERIAASSFGDATARLDGSPRLRLVARGLERLLRYDRALGGEIFVVVAQRPVAS